MSRQAYILLTYGMISYVSDLYYLDDCNAKVKSCFDFLIKYSMYMYLWISAYVYMNIIGRSSAAPLDRWRPAPPTHRCPMATRVIDSSPWCGVPRRHPAPSTRRGSMRQYAQAKSCFN